MWNLSDGSCDEEWTDDNQAGCDSGGGVRGSEDREVEQLKTAIVREGIFWGDESAVSDRDPALGRERGESCG